MTDCEAVARYGDILNCGQVPSVLLKSIHKINTAKAQEVSHPGNISKLVSYKTHFNFSLPSTRKTSKRLLSFRSFLKILLEYLIPAMDAA